MQTEKARQAIRAAKNRKNWGRYATLRYAEKRGILPLYRLAAQLEAASHIGD